MDPRGSKSAQLRSLGGPHELAEHALKTIEVVSGTMPIDQLRDVRRVLYNLALANYSAGTSAGRREQLAVPCVRCGFSVPPQNGSDP